MKPFRRLAEPEELISLSEALSDSFDLDVRSKSDILSDFLDRLRGGVLSRLKSDGFVPKDTRWESTYSKLLDLVTSNRLAIEDHNYLSHVSRVLSDASDLESMIERGDLERAVVQSMQLTARLLYRDPVHSCNRVSWAQFDPLYGDYPEIADMYPSSMAGQLAEVLLRAREIWCVDENLPGWKREQAGRLKEIYGHVFQYADRYGNDWAEPDHQTTENPMAKLERQIDPKLIMQFTRSAKSHWGGFDSRITEAEVFALYAIVNAYQGLHELWMAEFDNEDADQGWVQKYLSEAEGFLRAAVEYQVKNEGRKALRNMGKNNRQGVTRAKEAMIEGLLSVCRERGAPPTSGKLDEWLKSLPDDQFDTGVRECPSIRSERFFDDDGRSARRLVFTYRDSGKLLDRKISFGTYKREYLPLLKKKIGGEA